MYVSQPIPPSNTLWVGSLPDSASEDDIRSLFTPYGEVCDLLLLPISLGVRAV